MKSGGDVGQEDFGRSKASRIFEIPQGQELGVVTIKLSRRLRLRNIKKRADPVAMNRKVHEVPPDDGGGRRLTHKRRTDQCGKPAQWFRNLRAHDGRHRPEAGLAATPRTAPFRSIMLVCGQRYWGGISWLMSKTGSCTTPTLI